MVLNQSQIITYNYVPSYSGQTYEETNAVFPLMPFPVRDAVLRRWVYALVLGCQVASSFLFLRGPNTAPQ